MIPEEKLEASLQFDVDAYGGVYMINDNGQIREQIKPPGKILYPTFSGIILPEIARNTDPATFCACLVLFDKYLEKLNIEPGAENEEKTPLEFPITAFGLMGKGYGRNIVTNYGKIIHCVCGCVLCKARPERTTGSFVWNYGLAKPYPKECVYLIRIASISIDTNHFIRVVKNTNKHFKK